MLGIRSFPFGAFAVSFRECTACSKIRSWKPTSCFGGPQTILTNRILRNTTTLMLTGARTILWSINSMHTIPLLVLFDHKCVLYWNIYQCSSSSVWNETKLFSYSTMKKKYNQRLTARNCSIVTIPVAMKVDVYLHIDIQSYILRLGEASKNSTTIILGQGLSGGSTPWGTIVFTEKKTRGLYITVTYITFQGEEQQHLKKKMLDVNLTTFHWTMILQNKQDTSFFSVFHPVIHP